MYSDDAVSITEESAKIAARLFDNFMSNHPALSYRTSEYCELKFVDVKNLFEI